MTSNRLRSNSSKVKRSQASALRAKRTIANHGSQESAAALVSQALLYNPSQIWNFGMYPMMKITTMSTGMP